MNALSRVTSLEEVLWGIGLVAVTMTIHAFAMPMTLAVCSVAERRCRNWPGFFAGVCVLLLAQRFQDEQLKRMSIDPSVDPQ